MSRTKNYRTLRLRSRERGAAIFVVMMAILLLTGLGTWVVYASGLAASGAGNQRANTQAVLLAELGVLSGTGYLAMPEMASKQMAVAEASLVGNTPDSCQSVPSSVDVPFCKSIHMPDIDDATVNNSTYSVLDLTGAEGSMGPNAGVTEGYFFMEISDRRNVLAAGSAASGSDTGAYKQVTISSYGRTRPAGGGFCTGAEGENASATMIGIRTQAVLGPLN